VRTRIRQLAVRLPCILPRLTGNGDAVHAIFPFFLAAHRFLANSDNRFRVAALMRRAGTALLTGLDCFPVPCFLHQARCIASQSGEPGGFLGRKQRADPIRRSGVEKFRLYDLRHTFATRAIESGVDLVTLAALLGHSKIAMVQRYAHPAEKYKADAIRKIEQMCASRMKQEQEANQNQAVPIPQEAGNMALPDPHTQMS